MLNRPGRSLIRKHKFIRGGAAEKTKRHQVPLLGGRAPKRLGRESSSGQKAPGGEN